MLLMSLKYAGLCYRCHHFKQVELREYWTTSEWGYRKKVEASYHYTCNFLDRYIRKIKQTCKHFLDRRTQRLVVEVNGMVRIEEIPNEGETIDLKDLPQEAELIATGESYKPRSENSSAGIVITYKMRDERTFSQKYTAVSGAVLTRAMKDLKLVDTEDLQANWYKYVLTQMRMGKPRMIPIKKVKA